MVYYLSRCVHCGIFYQRFILYWHFVLYKILEILHFQMTIGVTLKYNPVWKWSVILKKVKRKKTRPAGRCRSSPSPAIQHLRCRLAGRLQRGQYILYVVHLYSVRRGCCSRRGSHKMGRIKRIEDVYHEPKNPASFTGDRGLLSRHLGATFSKKNT